MPSQAIGFAELVAGGFLLTMGITGASPRDVLAGKAGSPKGLAPAAGPLGAGGPLTPDVNPAPSTVKPHGGLANPLPGWSRSRIDQGVDFYGGRRIVAPESGQIVKLGAPGWPEGGGVLLHTISGSYIFFYEGLVPVVHAGEQVLAGQQIASGVPGGSIEVGFSDAAGVPLAHSEYFEGKVTKWGRKMAEWLTLLGAPR